MKDEVMVFISYAHQDHEIALRLYHDLKGRGAKPWIDKKDLLPGQKWKDAISKAIQDCSYFIALLSSYSVSKKGYVQNELKTALKVYEDLPSSDIYIIPVLIDECKPQDEILSLHLADLSVSYEEGLTQILRVILSGVQDTEGINKAGILEFYSDRKGNAEKSLEDAFEKHEGGLVRMAGVSLRLFLASGLHFYYWVERMLKKRGSSQIVVKALSCSPIDNHELPVRSFVEEFNQDGTAPPQKGSFNWENEINFCFNKFEDKFYQNYGIDASVQRCRVIQDLTSTRTGIVALTGVAMVSDNIIEHREFRSAPYCTVIIFPDRAYYTPNLLSTEFPVNMPMMVFQNSSNAYKKLVNYFEFLWWVSNPKQ